MARDDLPDEGAWLYAETVRMIRELNPDTGVEVLIPDFSGNPILLAEVFAAGPAVLAHNLETVPATVQADQAGLHLRAQPRRAGPGSRGRTRHQEQPHPRMGEEIDEVHQALRDLHDAGCDLVTITQYLRPSPRHHPVERWVRPEEFVALADVATDMGFAGVMSGPLVRSSYRAGSLYAKALEARGTGEGVRITVTSGV